MLFRGRGCPVCGDPDTACGPATATVPVDERIEETPAAMADLREYNVTVNGHDTTMNLTADEAARLNGTPVDTPDETAEPAEPPAEPAEPSAPPAEPAGKHRESVNKVRAPRDKSAT